MELSYFVQFVVIDNIEMPLWAREMWVPSPTGCNIENVRADLLGLVRLVEHSLI